MQTSTNILNKISGLDIMGFYGGLFQSGGGTPPSYTYATFDPATKTNLFQLTNSDLTAFMDSGWTPSFCYSTIGKSTGKWYFEINTNSYYGEIGVSNGSNTYGMSVEGIKIQDGYGAASYGSYLGGEVHTVGVLLDLDNLQLSFTYDGINQGVAFTIPSGEWKLYIRDIFISNYIANFGATPFAYPVPSGYNAGLYTE